jgi:hypothetical protein
MTNQYKIKSWDGVMSGNKNYPKPVIQIEPDQTLLDFAKDNNNVMLVQISQSGSIYDGKTIAGVLYESGKVPNCRPNYFTETGYYSFVMVAQWHSYPPSLGIASFFGANGGELASTQNNLVSNTELDIAQPDLREPTSLINHANNHAKHHDKHLNATTITGISVGLAVILFAVIIIIYT